jgi:hypothetical protein
MMAINYWMPIGMSESPFTRLGKVVANNPPSVPDIVKFRPPDARCCTKSDFDGIFSATSKVEYIKIQFSITPKLE